MAQMQQHTAFPVHNNNARMMICAPFLVHTDQDVERMPHACDDHIAALILICLNKKFIIGGVFM